MTTDILPAPDFETLTQTEARALPPRRSRRSWKPIVDTLSSGTAIFSTEITEADLKYLTLLFNTRRKGPERLRSRREVREGKAGRVLWLDKP